MLASALALALAAAALQDAPRQEPRFSERVEVARVVVDVRVLDGHGDAVLGLTPENFRVEVDGEDARVDSVHWVSGDEPTVPVLEPEVAERLHVPPSPPGRLLVFFFQKDGFERSRMPGLMKMRRRAAEMVAELQPEDRVAVLSFDSHLRFWLDFSNDRRRIERVLDRAILFENPPVIDPGPFPSLAAHFDRARARKAARIETALIVLGEALQPIQGAKSLALFGYGLGRMYGGRIVAENDYPDALRALERARVTVFALDVTDADYHSLEVGLQMVAEETGGFYVKTHDFPGVAMALLKRALTGHYLLSFEGPPSRGQHALKIRLVGRKGTVLARSFYESD